MEGRNPKYFTAGVIPDMVCTISNTVGPMFAGTVVTVIPVDTSSEDVPPPPPLCAKGPIWIDHIPDFLMVKYVPLVASFVTIARFESIF